MFSKADFRQIRGLFVTMQTLFRDPLRSAARNKAALGTFESADLYPTALYQNHLTE